MTRSYYAVLGIEEDADSATVTAAYRERVKAVHPDHSDAPDANVRFREVVRAREVLTDPDERARYDRLGHAAYTGNSSRPPRSESPPESDPKADSGPRQRDPTYGTATGWADDWRWEGGVGTGTIDGEEVAARAGYGSYVVERLRGFTPTRGVMALVSFILHPLFLAGTVYPVFSTGVKVTVGVAALVLLAVLLTLPEVGVVVFGGWTLLMPVLLWFTGVPWLSLLGGIMFAACVVPFTLSALTLTMLRP
jgi:molecular chaperone DnaJ